MGYYCGRKRKVHAGGDCADVVKDVGGGLVFGYHVLEYPRAVGGIDQLEVRIRKLAFLADGVGQFALWQQCPVVEVVLG